jgi:hypothetical protein
MSIVPLQYFRIDGTYIVDLETGENPSTLLPQWVYQKLLTDERWTCLRLNGPGSKAKETAGDAIVSSCPVPVEGKTTNVERTFDS